MFFSMQNDAIEDVQLEIIEQPQSAVRFRYKGEGPSHGGICGISSNDGQKTFPAVKVKNYNGNVKIVAQLVTNDKENPKLHPHFLVGKECEDGICTVSCGPKDMTARFSYLAIQRVKRKDAALELCKRYKGSPPSCEKRELSATENMDITTRAEAEAKTVDLNSVRLMFLAYYLDHEGSPFATAVSNPIYDSKSTGATQLKISKICPQSGCVSGQEEICVLCDKIHKDQIDVIFYEATQDRVREWEVKGSFSPNDVHHQYAISLKTPPYRNLSVADPVTVMVQLRRRTDNAVSNPVPFKYLPDVKMQEPLQMCEKRKINDALYEDNKENKRRKLVSVGSCAPGNPFAALNGISDKISLTNIPPLPAGVSMPTLSTQKQLPVQLGPVDPSSLKILRTKMAHPRQILRPPTGHASSGFISYPLQGNDNITRNISNSSTLSAMNKNPGTIITVQPEQLKQMPDTASFAAAAPTIIACTNVATQNPNQRIPQRIEQNPEVLFNKVDSVPAVLSSGFKDPKGLSNPESDEASSQKYVQENIVLSQLQPVPVAINSANTPNMLTSEQKTILHNLWQQQEYIENIGKLERNIEQCSDEQEPVVDANIDPYQFLNENLSNEQTEDFWKLENMVDPSFWENLVPEGDLPLELLNPSCCDTEPSCCGDEKNSQGCSSANGRWFIS